VASTPPPSRRASLACTVDGEGFACASAAISDGQATTITGTALSRSTASAQVVVTGPACQGELALDLRAAWRDGAAGYGGDARGGACPRSYDRYTTDGLTEQVSFTVDNQTDVDLGLYGLNYGSAVYYTTVPALSSIDTQYLLGGWLALATDYDAEACVHLFQVTDAGQVEVWRGE